MGERYSAGPYPLPGIAEGHVFELHAHASRGPPSHEGVGAGASGKRQRLGVRVVHDVWLLTQQLRQVADVDEALEDGGVH